MPRRDGGAPLWRGEVAEGVGGDRVLAEMLGRETASDGEAAPPVRVVEHLERDDVIDALGGLIREGHEVPRDVAHRLVEEAEDRDAARAAARRRAGLWREAVGGSAAAILGGRG